jgi:phosphopantothenoylcysteine decarboxylase/phosphopantothenate--cysteine ligase
VFVETAEDMFRESNRVAQGTDIFIGCAAVADYRPLTAAAEKIKRTDEEISLDLIRSPDTLASIAALPGGPFTVGFAAETEHVREHAQRKLESKRVDMIAANRVGPGCGFDRETNALHVFWNNGSAEIGEDTKPAVARRLIVLIAEQFNATRRPDGATQAAG